MINTIKRSFILGTCLLLAGCINGQLSRATQSVSLSKFVTAPQDSRQAKKLEPLNFPVSLAIAFVPDGKENIPLTTLRLAAEALKTELKKNSKYIGDISIVQNDDRQGTISLDEIQRGYGADTIIILSYQQDQRQSQSGVAGLLDISVVGAFVFPGVTNKTVTSIEAKIIHIPNNAILFRPSGFNENSTLSTTYGSRKTLQNESDTSFMLATKDLAKNISDILFRLEKFDIERAANFTIPAEPEKNKNSPIPPHQNNWDTVNSFKQSGGSLDILTGLMLALLGFGAIRRTKRAKP